MRNPERTEHADVVIASRDSSRIELLPYCPAVLLRCCRHNQFPECAVHPPAVLPGSLWGVDAMGFPTFSQSTPEAPTSKYADPFSWNTMPLEDCAPGHPPRNRMFQEHYCPWNIMLNTAPRQHYPREHYAAGAICFCYTYTLGAQQNYEVEVWTGISYIHLQHNCNPFLLRISTTCFIFGGHTCPLPCTVPPNTMPRTLRQKLYAPKTLRLWKPVCILCSDGIVVQHPVSSA